MTLSNRPLKGSYRYRNYIRKKRIANWMTSKTGYRQWLRNNWRPLGDTVSRIGQHMMKNRGPLPFGNLSKADIVGGYLAPRLAVGYGQYKNRHFRQKYFLGSGYNDMYRSQLINYRSRMPRAKQSTNRKNKSNVPKKQSRKVHRAKSTRKNITALANQVKDIRKTLKQDKSKHTHRYADSGIISSLDAECDHVALNPVTTARLEGATDGLRYFDPAVPGTLLTADSTTGAYSHDVVFKNVHSKLEVRNNYQVPARIKIYCCVAKSDGDHSPIEVYTNALPDQCVTAGADAESIMMFLTDIERVTEQWNIDCVVDKVLEGGQMASASHNTGEFHYDPSHQDTETTVYQKIRKSFCWVVRIEGVIAHDTAQAEYGISRASVDYNLVNKYEIIYDAGINLNDFSFNETRDTAFTNAPPVVSLKPVADNIAYSIT